MYFGKNYRQLSYYNTFEKKSARSTNLPAHQALIKFMQITALDMQRLFFFYYLKSNEVRRQHAVTLFLLQGEKSSDKRVAAAAAATTRTALVLQF